MESRVAFKRVFMATYGRLWRQRADQAVDSTWDEAVDHVTAPVRTFHSIIGSGFEYPPLGIEEKAAVFQDSDGEDDDVRDGESDLESIPVSDEEVYNAISRFRYGIHEYVPQCKDFRVFMYFGEPAVSASDRGFNARRATLFRGRMANADAGEFHAMNKSRSELSPVIAMVVHSPRTRS